MSERAAPRWTTGTWSGLPHYRCGQCRFETLDYGAIVVHARTYHPRPWESGETPDPLAGIPFASDAAAEAAHEAGLGPEQFTGQPTGKTGYTLADVRRFTSATTPTEE